MLNENFPSTDKPTTETTSRAGRANIRENRGIFPPKHFLILTQGVKGAQGCKAPKLFNVDTVFGVTYRNNSLDSRDATFPRFVGFPTF